MRDDSFRCLIVVPARNEEGTIKIVVDALRRVVPAYDRLFVNDCSTDRTGEILKRMGEKQLQLPVNLGYGLALQSGLKYAIEHAYDVVVCLDADGQHKAEDVPLLIRTLREEKADVVIGSRYCEGKKYVGPLGRRIGQRLFSGLSKLFTGSRVYDTTSGFKAMSHRAFSAMSSGVFLDFHIETIVRLSLLGLKTVEVPIVANERIAGVSMHTFTNAVQYPLKTLILTIAATADALINRRHT